MLIMGKLLMATLLSSCSAVSLDALGVTVEGKLAPCPNRPNCISSQASGEHFLKPFEFENLQETYQKLVMIVESMERAEIKKQTKDYLYFTSKSRFFGFVDDTEFYFDEVRKLLHFRSASRVGYSDMGVNRKRVQGILHKLSE